MVNGDAQSTGAQEKKKKVGFFDLKANFRQLGWVFAALFAFVAFCVAMGIDPEELGVDPKKRGPKPYSGDFYVPSGHARSITFDIPHPYVPGRLYGSYASSGASEPSIRGATDDTLVEFYVLGPDGKKLFREDHPVFGNFSVRVDQPGMYSLVFSNAGIVRSSGRKVKVEARYERN